jgi:1,6-anhydro-N-acetylmuramate kinase
MRAQTDGWTVIGMLSGTSCDAVDAAVARLWFDEEAGGEISATDAARSKADELEVDLAAVEYRPVGGLHLDVAEHREVGDRHATRESVGPVDGGCPSRRNHPRV